MQEHLKRNEAELNELLGEYWNLRHQTGKLFYPVPYYVLIVLLQRFTWRPSPTSSAWILHCDFISTYLFVAYKLSHFPFFRVFSTSITFRRVFSCIYFRVVSLLLLTDVPRSR